MGSTGSPLRNHHTDSIGDPETEQLNVAESPEFTTCEKGIRRHYCSFHNVSEGINVAFTVYEKALLELSQCIRRYYCSFHSVSEGITVALTVYLR